MQDFNIHIYKEVTFKPRASLGGHLANSCNTDDMNIKWWRVEKDKKALKPYTSNIKFLVAI